MVSAVDGKVSGGGGIDKFRIKIWVDGNPSNVVYDNNLGLDDNGVPTTALGGGSIVIHDNNVKSKVAIIKPEVVVETTLKAYPNPFANQLNFNLLSSNDTHARLEMFDLNGRKIAIVFDKDIKANDLYNINYKPETDVLPGVLLYRLTVDNQVFNGKVIYQWR